MGGRKNTFNVPDCKRFATRNTGTMSGKSGDAKGTLHRRKIDVYCVQDTRQTRPGATVMCEELSDDGSETWPTKVEHELKLNHTEMSMIRWMCGLR